MFDVLEITVLFFFYNFIPTVGSAFLWLDIHFSWRAVPNLSATDLVRITVVSEAGFQCYGPVESWPTLVWWAVCPDPPSKTNYPMRT